MVLARDLPSLEELQRFNPEQVSKIMSADGKIISELGVLSSAGLGLLITGFQRRG